MSRRRAPDSYIRRRTLEHPNTTFQHIPALSIAYPHPLPPISAIMLHAASINNEQGKGMSTFSGKGAPFWRRHDIACALQKPIQGQDYLQRGGIRLIITHGDSGEAPDRKPSRPLNRSVSQTKVLQSLHENILTMFGCEKTI